MAKKTQPPRATGDNGVGAATAPIALVRGLAEVLAEHGLSELVYDTTDTSITLRRGGVAPTAATPIATVAHIPAHVPTAATPAAAPPEKGHQVTSPFVGTFYRRPNPDAAKYVDVGDRVQKGQTLCIIEAMKLMNEIEADISGVISGIMAEDGASVEYGQPLFRITAGS